VKDLSYLTFILYVRLTRTSPLALRMRTDDNIAGKNRV
jgi:hypothetical protein